MATIFTGVPHTTSATAERFAPGKPTGNLLLRLDNAANTDKVFIKINSLAKIVADDFASFYLMAGESVVIPKESIDDMQGISIVAASGTPILFSEFM